MSLLRKALEAADRPGARWVLSLASSSNNLSIRHDGSHWLYSSEGVTLPRGRRFDFYRYDLEHLPGRIRHYLNETEDCWFYRYKPKAGDIIVDVGAELGTDLITFSRAVGPTGKVIAIEAQPDTYELMLKTIEVNSLTNVVPVCVAVADRKGLTRISFDQGVESNFIGGENGVLVPTDTLDNILKDYPRIDLLKMNIEGAEQLAIMGMDETAAKTRHMAIACHDFIEGEWFQTSDKVADYLKRKGFEASFRTDAPHEYARYHLHAICPPAATYRGS